MSEVMEKNEINEKVEGENEKKIRWEQCLSRNC